MQEQNPTFPTTPSPVQPSVSSSFNATPPRRKLPLKMILGGIVLILLLVGAAAAYYLSQISQDVRQQASGVYVCSLTQLEQCGAQNKDCAIVDNQPICVARPLRGCFKPNADGTACVNAGEKTACPTGEFETLTACTSSLNLKCAGDLVLTGGKCVGPLKVFR